MTEKSILFLSCTLLTVRSNACFALSTNIYGKVCQLHTAIFANNNNMTCTCLRDIAYSYDASGNKLSANYRWRTLLSFSPKAEILSNRGIMVPSISTKQVEYASNLIYEDGKLKMLRLDGGDGYISFDEKGNYDYNLYQKDHAGNIMLVTDRSGNIKQETY